jgi:hypothetical protein
MRIYILSFLCISAISLAAFASAIEINEFTTETDPYELFLPKDKLNIYELSNIKKLLSKHTIKKKTVHQVKYEICRILKNKKTSSVKRTKFISEIILSNDIEIVINDISLKGNWLKFELRDHCTKLTPVSFVSTKAQKFLNIQLLKGDEVSFFEGKFKGLFGAEIDSSGYMSKNSIVRLHKKYPRTDSEHEKYYNSQGQVTRSSCLKISSGKKKSYYFNEKLYPETNVATDIMRVPSLYYGNKLCSINKSAKIYCEGYKLDFERYFDLSDDRKGDESIAALMRDYIKDKKECDQSVKIYEKKTGKKVPYSPHVPKKYIKKLLKEGDSFDFNLGKGL